MRREPHDLFYWDNHRRHDAELHDPILSDGDHAAARAISDAIMRRLGFTDRQIAELANSKPVVKAFNEDEPRDEDGRWSGGGGSDSGGGGFEFVSPSVASDLGLHDAISALSSKQQGALKTVSREIDQSLGLAGKPADAIGAWSDGAENTVVTVHSGTRAADYDKIAVAASMKGYIADQKGVLVFQEEEPDSPAGDAVLLSFSAKGSLAEIHQNLLSDGLAFHTLVPASGGATVYVAATEAKDVKGVVDATGRAAERYDSKITYRHGRGEFIGDFSSDGSDREQRDRARAVYETRIQQSTVPGSQALWKSVHDRWSKTADKIAASFRREFNEDEPRDEDGRWSGGGGGGGGESGGGAAADMTSHGIKGLPKDIVVKDPLFQQAIERGAFDMVAKTLPKNEFRSGRQGYNVKVAAKIPPGIKQFSKRAGTDRVGYYNPKLAELVTEDKGVQYLERTYARALPGLSQEIAPLPDKDIIYRGMRAEEYEQFLKTGEIVSTGAYNMEGQEGLTYWATNPSTATSYANGFAPWPHKATFEKPAYVVATKMPKETRRVPGTGESEVGVARPITKDEIVGVWRGDVYAHDPGEHDLNPISYDQDEKVYAAGGGVGASSSVVWQKVAAGDDRAAKHAREFNEDEPRDEDGRWSGGGGGGGGGGTSVADYSPGLKAVNDNASIRATKSDWIATSPIKTFDDVLRAAPKAQSALGEVGAGIADKLGVEFKNPGPKTKNEKGIARTKDKIAARGGNNAAVTDVARGTFIVSHPSQVEAIVADLSKHFQVTLENWRKTDLGYMDRAALVRFDNGLIGEVQFMDAGMANAKSDTGGDGHGLYVKWRALDLDKPSERVVADGLVADMRKLYGAVTEAYPPEWKAALGSSGT